MAVALLAVALGLWGLRVPGPERGERQPVAHLFAAVRYPPVAAGLWLLALPSLMFGVLGVLAPLRLSHLGVPGSAIGAIFLVTAVFEAGASVIVGRWSDRSGRGAPLRASLLVSAAVSLALPWTGTAWSLATFVALAGTAYAAFFAPAMALLADAAEGAGLEQALGFALLNVAWAPGHMVGSGAGGALADSLGDAAPYLMITLLCLLTLVPLRSLRVLNRPSKDTGIRAD